MNNGPHGGNVECVHFAIWRKERGNSNFYFENLTFLDIFQISHTNKANKILDDTLTNIQHEQCATVCALSNLELDNPCYSTLPLDI